MPKRTDIKSILIIGAGPIIIGQACEFDYSGAQACKALKAEGYRVILVNSNPATIMTDPGLADATYVEPITPEIVEKIIAREIPATIVYEDDLVLAFRDVNPKAPTHALIVPKKCIPRLAEAGIRDAPVVRPNFTCSSLPG